MMYSQNAVVSAAGTVAFAILVTGCVRSGRPPEQARVTTPANPSTPLELKGTAVPVGPGRPVGFDSTHSAADLMFQSDEPFAQSASGVNVFGELDGFGPSVFNIGGQGGFQQHTTVDEGYDADPDVAPDGRHLLFASTRHAEHPDLYLQRVDGLAVTQLTSDPADDGFGRFSPDGTRIAFASNRNGNWDIYVMDVDGKDVRQITRAASNEIHPTFSPDGERLAFCLLGSRSGQWEIWTVDIATGRRQMVGYGLFPDWSPRADKDVIAFQRARQRGTRWFSAWTLELTGDDAKNVTEVAYSTNAAIVCPKWNADGTRLTFCSIIDPNATAQADPKMQMRGTTQDIWVVNADGTNRQRLTDGKGMNATPSWARDGRVYFVSDRGGNDSIWSVAAGSAKGVASGPAAHQLPAAPEVSIAPTETHLPPPHGPEASTEAPEDASDQAGATAGAEK